MHALYLHLKIPSWSLDKTSEKYRNFEHVNQLFSNLSTCCEQLIKCFVGIAKFTKTWEIKDLNILAYYTYIIWSIAYLRLSNSLLETLKNTKFSFKIHFRNNRCFVQMAFTRHGNCPSDFLTYGATKRKSWGKHVFGSKPYM